jgi:hypothetical protein
MKTAFPEIHIEFAGHHRTGRQGIGDKKDVFVRRARKAYAVQAAHRTVGAVAAGQPVGPNRFEMAVLSLDRRGHVIRMLCKCDKFGIPLHVNPPAVECVSEQPLVVVLAQDQQVGVGAQIASHLSQRDARHLPALDPEIRAACLRQCDRPLGNAHVNKSPACVPARLAPWSDRWAGIAFDDQCPKSVTRELVGQHQPGRACADDQHVDFLWERHDGVERTCASDS